MGKEVVKRAETPVEKKKKVLHNTIRELLSVDKLSKIGTPLKNPLHERFCLIYSVTLDATNSYLLARQEIASRTPHSDAPKKKRNATTTAAVLLGRDDVRTRLAEIYDYTASRLLINKSKIIADIQNEIDADPLDIMDWSGDQLTLRDLKSIPPHVRKTIKSIKQLKDGTISLTFFDKQKAREMLMKHLSMLGSDGMDVNVNIDLGDVLAEANRRVINRQLSDSAIEADYTEVDE